MSCNLQPKTTFKLNFQFQHLLDSQWFNRGKCSTNYSERIVSLSHLLTFGSPPCCCNPKPHSVLFCNFNILRCSLPRYSIHYFHLFLKFNSNLFLFFALCYIAISRSFQFSLQCYNCYLIFVFILYNSIQLNYSFSF